MLLANFNAVMVRTGITVVVAVFPVRTFDYNHAIYSVPQNGKMLATNIGMASKLFDGHVSKGSH